MLVNVAVVGFDVGFGIFNVLAVKDVIAAARVKENTVGLITKSPASVAMAACSLPDNFVLKAILAKDHVQHHLDVMRSVPVAMIVEAASLL